MAQYNLVGYNASPTNVEYEQAKAAWERTPRTNWAEFALREEQLKEQKKSNRIKNVLDVVNTAATAVNTYENVLNSELQRDSQRLINQERTLDIQSKQIDVNKKITETEADLAYTTKLREFQKSGDYASGLQLMLSSPEAAFRNSPQTKSFIEESRFKHTPNVEETYTAIFPDEAYKHKQDDLNRQTQLQVASIHEAGADRRARMSIDAMAPLREAQLNYYNARTAKATAEANFAYGMGTPMPDMNKLYSAHTQAKSSAQTAIANDPVLSNLNFGNTELTLQDFANGGIKQVDLDNTEELAKATANLNATLNGGMSTSVGLNRIVSEFGSGAEGLTPEGITEWQSQNKKSKLLEYTDNTGATSYYIVDKATVDALNKFMRSGTDLNAVNVISQLQHLGGDLSKLTPYQLQALSEKDSNILRELNNQYNGHLLDTATPKQQRTTAFKSLAANLQQSVQQMPAPNAQNAEQPNSISVDQFVRSTANTPAKQWNNTIRNFLASKADNEINKYAMNNLVAQKGLDITALSPEQMTQLQQELQALPESVRRSYAEQHMINLMQQTNRINTQAINTDNYGQTTTAIVRSKQQNPEGIDIAEEVNKLINTAESTLERNNYKSSNIDSIIVDKEQQVLDQLITEVKTFIESTGNPVKVNYAPELNMWWRGAFTTTLDSPEAVDNYVKEYKLKSKRNRTSLELFVNAFAKGLNNALNEER